MYLSSIFCELVDKAAMTQAVPGLNHVVEQILRRRSRDDYVVAGVIASCVLITLWYVFR